MDLLSGTCRFCLIDIVWAGDLFETREGFTFCARAPFGAHEAQHPSQSSVSPREHRIGCLLCNTPTFNANALCDRHQPQDESPDAEVIHFHTRRVAR